MATTTTTTALRFYLLWAFFAAFVAASSTTRNPLRAISTIQNATIHTHTHRVTALHNFDLSFVLRPDLHVKLSLEPNDDLLPNTGLVVSYLNSDGSVSRTEDLDRLAHKVFRGSAWYRQENVDDEWIRAGWARITIVKDGLQPLFQGAFALDHDNHHIQLAPHFAHTRHHLDPHVDTADENSMVVYRDSDILLDQHLDYHMHELRSLDYDDGLTCQSDNLGFNSQPDHPVYTAMLRRSDSVLGSETLGNLFGKRQVDSSTAGNSAGVDLSSTIGQTRGCPNTRQVALVGVATDCTYTAQFNSTESVRMNVIDQMNTASSIYERTFNISLGLANLTISDSNCPGTPNSASPWNQACSDSVDIQDRLNLFSAWRGNLQDQNSHWTLLSTCNTGSAVGLAWLGQACVQTAYSTNSSTTGNGQSSTDGAETVTGANVVVRTQGASEWQIIAHETGHTFGAVHDCTDQTCAQSTTVGSQQCCPLSSTTCNAGEQYIMNPSTSAGVKNFSPCSIGNICSALGRNSVKSTCLTANRNIKTIGTQECGNGIVEEGEDCDCGGESGCADNSCCDAKTCKFKNNAVCDDSNEGCCNNCQFASNGTVCRASTGSCDPAETCSGTSGTCPQDANAPDGQKCGSGLQCASGQCTSRDQQCRSVMGAYQGVGNNTSACDSSTCQIKCSSGGRSSVFGNNVCFEVQQNFLDGTPCGGGGKCSNGRCRGTDTGGQIRSWIDDHKGIVIGVCCGVGGLLLFAILSCCVRSCKRRRSKPVKMQSPPPGWGTQMRPMPPSHSYPPPPQHYNQGYGQGYGQWAPPQGPPPPAYTPGARYA